MLAIIRKQFMDMQGRLLTYPIFALTVSILSVNPSTTYFLMALTAIALISDVVNQTAGDDRNHGTFEFIFTRAIDRRGYVAAKYFFGLPMLLAFIGLCFLFEWMNVRGMFFSLITEVGDMDLAGRAVGLRAWGMAALLAILLYSVAFFATVTAGTEAAPSSIIFVAAVGTAVYAAAAFGILARLIGGPGRNLEMLQNNKLAVALGAALVVPAFVAFTAAREHYARRTLPLSGSVGARTRSMGWLGLVLLLVVLGGIVAYLALAVRPATPNMQP